MTPDQLDSFREIWLVDTEFVAPPGDRPRPVCLVAREYRTKQLIRLDDDQLKARGRPPYSVGPDALFVAYYASAEIGTHLALGWPLPARVLDLFAEFRCKTAGLSVPHGNSLLGALSWHGLDAMDAGEKQGMRELIMGGGPWSGDEMHAILDYCQEDVDALARLLPRMLPGLDLPRALLRGRYMAAAARMEWNGVPVDVPMLTSLRGHWDQLRQELVAEVNRSYGVYDGSSFRMDRFAAWLARNNVPWPRLDSGALALDENTFSEMADLYPAVSDLHDLRVALSQLRLEELGVGADGRNRCLLSAFASKTGRNQPSTSKFIFGPAVWLRGLIRPSPGKAVAYVDWSQQEFGIAAALSGDAAMMEAYRSGDPYLTFGKQAGQIPRDGNRKTHEAQRELFKGCVLGVQYGMGEESLGRRIREPPVMARELLRLHRQTYATFWRWSDAAVQHAMLFSRLSTVFGWTVRAGADANPRSLRNFPMQANGAEMLRLACCRATEEGLTVCAPVHDAILVEGDAGTMAETVARVQAAMEEASWLVLGGFALRSDAKVVAFPDRYADKRGERMWGRLMRLLPESTTCAPVRG